MDRFQFYLQQAKSCQSRSRRATDARVRVLAARERQDWLTLARGCQATVAIDRVVSLLDELSQESLSAPG